MAALVYWTSDTVSWATGMAYGRQYGL